MSKFNLRKSKFGSGYLAGIFTRKSGKYSDEELLRRITLSNLLFESNYYQSADRIMKQIEDLVKKVSPEFVVSLAEECRFEQKLRHTPLWLLLLVNEYHKNHSIAEALGKISTRPDMLMDFLGMMKFRYGRIKPISKTVKKGMRKAFDNYDEYQIAKYKRTNSEISLIDVVNLVHPKPNSNNEAALKKLVDNTLESANTWEYHLAKGDDKKETFERMIEENSLGSLAILRNIRNMKEAEISRKIIKKAISQVNSRWLTPLNFLAAQRVAPEYTEDINNAMQRCFVQNRIPGTTIVAVDVSGSMGVLTSKISKFSRMDLAFAMSALASFIFEDMILVFTAGNDRERKGKHIVWNNSKGLGVMSDFSQIFSSLGGGGIFTYQLCEWLKTEGFAKDADRLVVISDSQDIDAANGLNRHPDLTPYKTSYIIDISTNTHGIKTTGWTAEINGWSDKLFHYIFALEKPRI